MSRDKTPEEMANEYSWSVRADDRVLSEAERSLARSGFYAGFNAGRRMTERDVFYEYLEIKVNDTWPMKAKYFVLGCLKAWGLR